MRVGRLPVRPSFLCASALSLLFLGTSRSPAQDNPNLQNGLVPFGSFNGGAIDSVNVFNGNLNIHIPLFNYPQRGSLPGQFMITGNTKSFFVAQSCNPQTETCTLHWNTRSLGVGIVQVSDELGLQTPWRSNSANGLHVVSWDGSSHQMWGGLSLDGTGIFMNNAFPPTQFLNKNGNGTPSSSGNMQQQDTNGNYFNWTSIGASYTDTLGRTFTGTYPGPNGTTMQVQITSVNVTIQTNFQASGTDMYQNLDPITEYGPINVNLIQSIAVYDGNSWATSPTWTFQYNDRDPGDPSNINYGNVTQITLPTGGTISYAYGMRSASCGNSAPLTPVSRGVISRTVNANDGTGPHTTSYNLSIVTDPLGNDTAHGFTGLGGSCSFYETETDYYQGPYSANHLLKKVQTAYAYKNNPNGVNTTDDAQTVVSVVPTTITTTLDNGFVSQVVNTWDHQTGSGYTYGNLLEKDEYDYGNGAPGPLLRKTVYTYLAFDNSSYLALNMADRVSSVTVYDGSGNQIAKTTYGYDETGVVTSGISTNLGSAPGGSLRGNQTSVCRWLNTTGANLCTNTTYYDTGMPYQVTDPNGNVTTYTYSSAYAGAYVTQTTMPQTGSVQHVVSGAYDFNTGELTSFTDQNGQPFSYQYDSLWRPTTVSYPDQGQTTFGYPNPNTISVTTKINSSQNLVETSLFDGVGRTKQTQLNSDPEGVDYTDTAYDADGRLASVSNPYRSTSDPTYGVTSYQYDALGRTCVVVPPDGTLPSGNACPTTQPSGTVFTTYSGNCVTVTDEAGKSRQSCSDGPGRLTQVTEDPGGLGYVTSYGYDALDNLLSVVQNGSRQRTFNYDSLSRLTQAINPESGTTTFTYDANGNLNGKTDARGVGTGYCYDALNRLACKIYSSTFAIGYYYDQATWGSLNITNPVGRLTSMGTYDGTCWPTGSGFSYDAMGRVTTQVDYLNTAETSGCPGIWTTISAGYDLAGNQISLTYPSGRVIKSQYDCGQNNCVSRLTNLKVDDLNGYNYLSNATYAPNGAPATFALGNSLTETSTYNKRFQPNDLKVASSSTSLLDHIYNFNPGHDNGNVQSIADNLVSGRTQNFTYDTLNRLSTAQTTATSGTDCWGQQYGYDAWGNLLTETPNVSGCPTNSLSLGVNANNQITNTGFGYDPAGNMTNDGIAGNTYVYDNENHLTSLNSGAATYIYDAQGRRMAKKIGSATTEYIYFNGDVLTEYNVGDLVWNDYVFAGGRRLAAAGTDDILNPGFEQGMEGWSWGASDSTGTAQVITDPTRSHSGNNYLQLSSVTANSVSAGQVFAVNPGDQLTFGGWAYIEAGSASATGVAWDIWVADANGNILAYYGSAVTTQGVWTYLSTNYTVPSGGASVGLYCQIYQPTGAITARFDDAFLTGASGAGVHYYHADHLGSARLMTDSGGNQTWSATYLPFGQEWNPQATTNHYKFTGQERDSESGNDNFEARYYASTLARFLSPDPAGNAVADASFPQSWNLYSYVLNNPLNFIDPNGLDCAYLNDAGTAAESIDHNSNIGECEQNGGYWANGWITNDSWVQTNPFNDSVVIKSQLSDGTLGVSVATQTWTQGAFSIGNGSPSPTWAAVKTFFTPPSTGHGSCFAVFSNSVEGSVGNAAKSLGKFVQQYGPALARGLGGSGVTAAQAEEVIGAMAAGGQLSPAVAALAANTISGTAETAAAAAPFVVRASGTAALGMFDYVAGEGVYKEWVATKSGRCKP